MSAYIWLNIFLHIWMSVNSSFNRLEIARKEFAFAQCASLLPTGIGSRFSVLFVRTFHWVWIDSSHWWETNWDSANVKMFQLKFTWSVEYPVSNYKPNSSHLITSLVDSFSVSFNPTVVKWFSNGCICFLLLPDNFLMSTNSLCESKVISSNG